MDGWLLSPFIIPVVAIAGGLLVAMIGTISKARIREMEIRERIAMIERGLVPPPETDPSAFERRMEAVDRIQMRYATSAPRFRSGGIMVMSVGFGLMLLISVVGAEREGIGVGGFLVIIGLGMLVNSLMSRPPYPSQPPPPPGNGPSDTFHQS